MAVAVVLLNGLYTFLGVIEDRDAFALLNFPCIQGRPMFCTRPAAVFVLRTILLAGSVILLARRADAAVSCTVTPSSVVFGNYDPTSTMPNLSSGNIAVSCGSLVLSVTPFTVALSSGTSGSMAARAMANGGSQLQYQLYTDSARSIVAGDGTGGSSTMSGTITNVAGAALGSGSTTMNVYGRIPAGQIMATPGNYVDTVLVTVSF